jgi:hypothetical protein
MTFLDFVAISSPCLDEMNEDKRANPRTLLLSKDSAKKAMDFRHIFVIFRTGNP